MQQKLNRLNARISSRLQAMADRGQPPPQLVHTKELLQLTEFEEQVMQTFPNRIPVTVAHYSLGHRVPCGQVHRRRQIRRRRRVSLF
jgi:hypothetical protein